MVQLLRVAVVFDHKLIIGFSERSSALEIINWKNICMNIAKIEDYGKMYKNDANTLPMLLSG